MSDFDSPSHDTFSLSAHDHTDTDTTYHETHWNEAAGPHNDPHAPGAEYLQGGADTFDSERHPGHAVSYPGHLPLDSEGSALDPHDPGIGYERYEPDTSGFSGCGEPEHDMTFWHEQTHPDTCAVVSQEYVLDGLLGHDIPEDQLRYEAYEHGWYTPGGGTPLECMGNLLELHGIDVEQHYGSSISDLMQQLDEGHKVIVAVDAHEIWHDGVYGYSDQTPLSDYGAIPGLTANHAVEVIGIDTSDPDNPKVILNDPGTPDGQGLMVPASEFQTAWSASDNFVVHTTCQTAAAGNVTDTTQAAGGPKLGDWVWYDGHWISV